MILTLAALVAAAPATASANDSIGYLVGGVGASRYAHPVASIRERRFIGVVPQHTDFSCGAAAIATLFRYAFAAKVTESDILAGLLNDTDPALVRERGFSLLDLRNYARTVGLQSEGYQIQPASLLALTVPAVVLVDVQGYHHFVVLRHADAQFAYVADPALGNRTIPLPEFVASWNGIALIMLGRGYRKDNALVHVTPPLGARDLFAAAPTGESPALLQAERFVGVPPVQRL